MSTLYILRGLSGSGKSTLARQLLQDIEEDRYNGAYRNPVICSTDNFWIRPDQTYDFNYKLLSQAHWWCQQEVRECMISGYSDVILDNCNAKLSHMQPYEAMARVFGYRVDYLYPKTEWAWNAAECAHRNTHGVSFEIIQKVLEGFEFLPGETDRRPEYLYDALLRAA